MDDKKREIRAKNRIKESVHIADKTGCWLWVKGGGRYGLISYQDKTISVHRLSYLLFIGKIPDGYCVCHTCDTPRCVNPDHLFVGSHKDNEQDKTVKGRRPDPWNKGLTINDPAVEATIKKATAKRRDNYIEKCREVYEFKNKTKSTYKELESIFNISSRQLLERYKSHERKMLSANGSLL